MPREPSDDGGTDALLLPTRLPLPGVLVRRGRCVGKATEKQSASISVHKAIKGCKRFARFFASFTSLWNKKLDHARMKNQMEAEGDTMRIIALPASV